MSEIIEIDGEHAGSFEATADEQKKIITVFLDGKPKEIRAGTYTTEELITLLGVPAGYLLNVVKDGHLETLKPNQRLHLREGMQFFSQVPCGGSSS